MHISVDKSQLFISLFIVSKSNKLTLRSCNQDLSTSILNGTIPLSRLNDMVTRIVATWYQFGQDQDYPVPNFSSNTADATGPCYPGALFSPTCVTNEYVNVQADHAKVARKVSREAITLLKNDNKTLPLSTSAVLKIFGSDAQNNPDGVNACTQRSCDTGVLGMGWGSGMYKQRTAL